MPDSPPHSHLPPLPMGASPRVRAKNTPAPGLTDAEAQVDMRQLRAYRLEQGNPALALADRAIRAAGIEPHHVPTGGGSDAHEFNAKGITTACLGAGYRDAHAVTEFMPHDQLRLLTDVSIQLVLNASS